MNIVIEILKNFNGFWYYITVIICIILITAIIGYLMERKQKIELDLIDDLEQFTLKTDTDNIEVTDKKEENNDEKSLVPKVYTFGSNNEEMIEEIVPEIIFDNVPIESINNSNVSNDLSLVEKLKNESKDI